MLGHNVIDTAVNIALESNMTQKHGAVLFSGNTIYSKGFNSINRTIIGGCTYPAIHAEMNCLMKYTNTKWCLLWPKILQEEIL